MLLHLLKPKVKAIQIKTKPRFGKAFALDKAMFSSENPFQLKEVSPRFACRILSTVPTPLSVTLHHSAR